MWDYFVTSSGAQRLGLEPLALLPAQLRTRPPSADLSLCVEPAVHIESHTVAFLWISRVLFPLQNTTNRNSHTSPCNLEV